MICSNCKTKLPDNARFCIHCGAPQNPVVGHVEEPLLRIDLDGDLELQFSELFFTALKERVELEQNPALVARYAEHLYQSGFRDVVYRRSVQLAERFKALQKEGQLEARAMSADIRQMFDELLDYFIIKNCKSLNDYNLPDAILKYQGLKPQQIDRFQMVLDYLDFDHEPQEKVYFNFLKMPVEKIKNAGKFFLFPEKDETIWLICDQSLLGSCKEGFAMTAKGLYWKAQLQTARQYHYTDNLTLAREKDWLLINGHFFNVNPGFNIKIMKLLRKLHQLAM
ncbi:MAG TPA: zinc ribbon domain-containing protein [Saprospiraceae bacterium]|nr:zinc ribbon domain-containing protein [Saprospiraceae bacterium]HMQ83362.1 zinc ribbon domain-containing protein [Saprospiraceae bacterium]